MKYYAKKETIYTTTKYEKISKGKLRKISILKTARITSKHIRIFA